MEHSFLAFALYIVIFLLGMLFLKSGLQWLAAGNIRRILEKAADHPVKGFVIGTFASAFMQSSSAVAIITVGMTSAGILRFSQTVGIILGANIGTTATGEIATLHIGSYYIVLLGLGLVGLIIPVKKLSATGAVFFGLGCLFAAMNGFSRLAGPLERSPIVRHLLNAANDHILYAVVFGIAFTMIIQSSSAATLVAMGFLDHGNLTLHSAIAIMLGSNIGTCFATYLAGIGSSWPAKWTAYTHILFNILGVALFIPFIELLADLTRLLAADSRLQLAHSAVIFNLSTALLALPFAGRFGIWVENRHRFLK